MAQYHSLKDHDLWADIIIGVGTSVAASLITVLWLKHFKVI